MTIESDLWDALPDAVLVLREGTVEACNRAAGALLGRTTDSLPGAPLEQLMAAGEPDRIELLLSRRRAGWLLPESCRTRFLRADGSEVVADVRIGNIGDGRRMICARNITDATRAERLIAELAVLVSDSHILAGADALLATAEPVFRELGWTVAFTEVRPDSSVTLRVVAEQGDPVGDYGRSLLGQQLPMSRTPVVAQVTSTGNALFLDDLPRRPVAPADARALSASMEAARVARSAWCPIKSEGRVTHVLAVTSADLSEHDFVAIQLFANQLGAAERLYALRTELIRNERLAAVGEMSAVLAHEVRNPVTVMLNAVTTLRRLEQNESALGLLDILVEEIGRLRRLVDDLLDFASPSLPSLEPVSLAELVSGALEAARHDVAYEQKTPVVQQRLAPKLPDVEVDAHLARRVLVNLLVNAFQHVPAGGQVSVAAEVEGATVRLSIHNDGPRIDADVAPRVFEPFFTTMPSGSGLGLAIVKRILASIGGSVELAPSDAGATFVVRLPVAR